MASGCSLGTQPFSDEEITQAAARDLSLVTAGQEAIAGPISIYEAMARALKYNLDYRIEAMQTALRQSETGLATAQMLPQLTARAGYSARDSYFQSTSLDMPTGTEVKRDLVSSDRAYNDGDITFSWNVLDFALSYVRAHQAADKYLIAQETKRKVIQRIIEDTRTAYWRAVSADRMTRRLVAIEKRAKAAIANAQATVKSGAEAPLTALTYERELVTIRQTAERLQHELSVARSQLAAFMNVAPGTPFKLIETDLATPHVAFGLSAEEMVAEAIFNRAEIREVAYETRINEQEAIAALLDVLPGIKVYGSEAFNDNHFLMHNDWLSWGVAASDGLLKLVQLPAKRATIEAEHAWLQQRALATTMIVMTQVHVSRIRFQHYSAELQTAREYLKAQSALVHQLRAEASAESVSQQTLIREEMNEIVAEVQKDIAHGNVQSAASSLLVSMGLNVQAREIDRQADTKSLAGHLQHLLADRVALSDRAKHLAELTRQREEARRKAAEEERRRRDEAQRVIAEAQRAKDEQARQVRVEAQRVRDEADRAKREVIEVANAERQRLKREAEQARVEVEQAKRAAAAERLAQQREADAERLGARREFELAKRTAEAEKKAQLRETEIARLEAKREAEHARRVGIAEQKAAQHEAELARHEAKREAEKAKREALQERQNQAQEAHQARDEAKQAALQERLHLKREADLARQEARQARKAAVGRNAKGATEKRLIQWRWPWEEAPRPLPKKGGKPLSPYAVSPKQQVPKKPADTVVAEKP